ncbi:MAG: FkbM family methyltransferase [Candidatus Tectimicrobiota bacterium]
MQPLAAAQTLCDLARTGGCPTAAQMRALQSPYLARLDDAELRRLADLLMSRLRSPGVRALVGEITPSILLTMVSAQESVAELLELVAYREQVIQAAVQAVDRGAEFSLDVRSAFGLLTSLHAEIFRQAILQGDVPRASLGTYVENGSALTAVLGTHRRPLPLYFETLLDAVGKPTQTATEWGCNSAVEVEGGQGRFTLMVSNGYELWRAATFRTQEPETVAWLDETLRAGDCLYDIGANIGLYSLYALARAPGAQAVCFEPDAVNYYRLGLNMLANDFGARAVLFPVALSESTGLATFNSSLFVAGKAENWISPGAELCGPAMARSAWQPEARVRTGCPTFDLDGLLAQAAFLPAPTHLKIDVDSVEVAILRGASQTLHSPRLRHLLVELYAREMDEATRLLAAAGFRHVRSVAQRNVLPCYEEFLGNHLFVKEPASP